MATLFSVMLMAARYEKARQAKDWNKVIALEKEMVTAAIELEKRNRSTFFHDHCQRSKFSQKSKKTRTVKFIAKTTPASQPKEG